MKNGKRKRNSETRRGMNEGMNGTTQCQQTQIGGNWSGESSEGFRWGKTSMKLPESVAPKGKAKATSRDLNGFIRLGIGILGL